MGNLRVRNFKKTKRYAHVITSLIRNLNYTFSFFLYGFSYVKEAQKESKKKI